MRDSLWFTEVDPIAELTRPSERRAEHSLKFEASSLGLAATSDGARVVIGLFDGRVAVVDAATRSVLTSTPAHEGHIDGVATADDPGVAFSVATDGRLLRWNLDDGTYKELAKDRFPLVDVAATPDGSVVVVAGWSTSLELFDGRTGELLGFMRGPRDVIYQLALTDDGRWLAGGGEDGTVYVWDLEGRRLHQRLVGHTERVTSLSFQAETQRLVSAARDGLVKEWDIHAAGGSSVMSGHLADVPAVQCSPDGRWVASGGRDGTLRIWDLDAAAMRRVLMGHPGEMNRVAWSEDSRRVYGGDRGGYVTAWEVATGEQLWRARPSGRAVGGVLFAPRTGSHGEECWALHHGGSIAVYDARTGAELAILDGVFEDAGDREGLGFAVTPDGSMVLLGTPSGEVVRIDRRNRRIVDRCQVHSECVYFLDVSPDGERYATASRDRSIALGRTIRLDRYERMTLESEASSSETAGLEGVAFSPDGAHLAIASRTGSVRVVDASSMKEILRLPGHFSWVRCVDFAPDGRRLVSSGSDGTVRIWDDLTSAEKSGSARRHFEERERSLELAERLEVSFDDPRGAEKEIENLPLDDDQRARLVGLAHEVLGTRMGLLDECWSLALAPEVSSEVLAGVVQVTRASFRAVQRDSEGLLLAAWTHLRMGDVDTAERRLDSAMRMGLERDPRALAVRSRVLDARGDADGATAAREAATIQLTERVTTGSGNGRVQAILDADG